MSQCLNKIPYSSREVAERVAGQYTKDSHKQGENNKLSGRSYGKGLTYRVYRCNICHKFHLSTKPKKGNK